MGTAMIDFQLLLQSLPALLQGVVVTLKIAFFGCIIGLSFGTIVALLQNYLPKPWSFIATTYVTIIRGTPMLIQILSAYFILPQIGLNLSGTNTAILAIGLNSAAYISQIIRSGIQSIGIGQIEAAKVLGLSQMQTIRYIILPQAFMVIIPVLTNELITLTKDSSLASIIGVQELSKQGSIIRTQTYDAITIFFGVGILYLIITTIISLLLSHIEKKVKRSC